MRRVAFGHMLFASLVGIVSGFYIFDPKFFVEYQRANENEQ